jgi:hypothetical protein
MRTLPAAVMPSNQRQQWPTTGPLRSSVNDGSSEVAAARIAL